MDDGTDVKPSGHVENYLEPLTGLNKALIDQHGMPLEQVTLPPLRLDTFLVNLQPDSVTHPRPVVSGNDDSQTAPPEECRVGRSEH